MRIVYCFIGPLPEYAIDTVHQTRLFYNGPIDFIISDTESRYVSILQDRYHVRIVSYQTVQHRGFHECIETHRSKFTIIDGLVGREKLFIYAFERFFVLYNWMMQQHLENVVFLELDNLIYDDPLQWEEAFASRDMAFMFDNVERCASGICFLRTTEILEKFLNCCIRYIAETDITANFMTEMQALDAFWKEEPDRVQILPTHWPSPSVPPDTYDNYHRYKKSIFDAAAIGIYIGGVDPYHTGGMVVTGLISVWSLINYTGYTFEWKKDENDRLIPYVRHEDGRWIRINNLHIHSKQLSPYLSKE